MNRPAARRHLPLCALLLFPAASPAQQAAPPPAVASAPAAPVWQARVLADPQKKLAAGLPYRLFVPKGYDAAKRYPVIVYLHGSGERGTDNQSQIAKNGPPRLVSDEVQAAEPCFVLAPQCPPELRWANWRTPVTRETLVQMAEEPSDPMRLVMQLLDEIPREFSIDARRVYLTGISMGGMGTWELLARRPKMFASAMPICGRADLSTAPQIKHIPVWAFHGDADDAVPVEHTRAMVKAMREADASIIYSEYKGVGHNSWDRAYDEPNLFAWLFAQRRPK